MSRIRTIKPEFWTSEQVLSCSPTARLLFVGLWNFCDDNGVHPASYVRLKAEIFPIDNCTDKDIRGWIGELIREQLLLEYAAVDGKSYWFVTGWKKHQRIDKPTYRHPLPASDFKKIGDISTTSQGVLDDNSSRTPRIVDEFSATEGNGKEWKVKEINICEVETSPGAASLDTQMADVQIVFDYWRDVMNHPRAKLDKKRKAKIMFALRSGFTVDELKQAIIGCSKTPHNMGKNTSSKRFDDIELILRDVPNIERFMGNAIDSPSNAQSDDPGLGIMWGVE